MPEYRLNDSTLQVLENIADQLGEDQDLEESEDLLKLNKQCKEHFAEMKKLMKKVNFDFGAQDEYSMLKKIAQHATIAAHLANQAQKAAR